MIQLRGQGFLAQPQHFAGTERSIVCTHRTGDQAIHWAAEGGSSSMSRLGRLCATAGSCIRAARLGIIKSAEDSACQLPLSSELLWGKHREPAALLRALHTSTTARQAADITATESFSKATGAERYELEAKAKGIDPFHEEWLDAPFGTEDKPVQVTSSFSERIVGVPDPYDDSIIWWGTVEEGQPPKQIIENGEFFVLKRLPDDDAHGH